MTDRAIAYECSQMALFADPGRPDIPLAALIDNVMGVTQTVSAGTWVCVLHHPERSDDGEITRAALAKLTGGDVTPIPATPGFAKGWNQATLTVSADGTLTEPALASAHPDDINQWIRDYTAYSTTLEALHQLTADHQIITQFKSG